MFASDIGIDLGTFSTIIYVDGKGIVLKEPSIVSMDSETKEVLAVGSQAYTMLGKVSNQMNIISPLENGVISDYEITEIMLRNFLSRVTNNRIFKPRVCVCVPSAITEVESRAVVDTVMASGARNVYLIEEPVAAAIGAGVDITKANGQLVLDIGGGTSDIAVLSLNGIVSKTSVQVAGNKLSESIIKYIRNSYNVLIGPTSAEKIKREIGSVWTKGKPEIFAEVKGRNLVTGLPQKLKISNRELERPLQAEVEEIIRALAVTLEKTPPELVRDIEENGLLLSGGGALLDGIDILISNRIRMKAVLCDNPTESVAIGTGKSFEYIGKLYDGFVTYANYSKR